MMPIHGEASNNLNATQASAVWQPSAWASLSRLVLVELRWIGRTPLETTGLVGKFQLPSGNLKVIAIENEQTK